MILPLLVLAVAPAPRADRDADLAALRDARPSVREEAKARLRGALGGDDLPRIEESARSSAAAREALVELLLDRADLQRAWMASGALERSPLFADLLRASFLRSVPGVLEGDHDFLETREKLHKALANSGRVRAAAPLLGIDDLAYEIRRSGLFPFVTAVDPRAAEAEVQLSPRIDDPVTVLLDDPFVLQWSATVPLVFLTAAGAPQLSTARPAGYAGCGETRTGAETVPALILFGAEPLDAPAERAGAWWREWRAGTGLAAVRAGIALVAAGVAPADAAIVSSVKSSDRRRAAAARRVLDAVPRRAASLLASDPPSLDAYLATAADGAGALDPRPRRVLEALPEHDGAKRSCDDLLITAARTAAPVRRAGWIEAIARRRSERSAAALREWSASGDVACAAPALLGLRWVDPQGAVDAAAARLAAAATSAEAAPAAAVLSASAAGPARAASALDALHGAARAAALSVVALSDDPAALARFASAVSSAASGAELEALAKGARAAAAHGNGPLLRAALRAEGTTPSCIASAYAGLVADADRPRAVEAICGAFRTGADRPALLALGALGDGPSVERELPAILRDAKAPLERRIAAAEAIVDYLAQAPPPRRAEMRDGVFKNLAYPAFLLAARAASGPPLEELRRRLIQIESDTEGGALFPADDPEL